MKKILLAVTFLCVFCFLPSPSMAIFQVDENGKPIERELKDGEITTMIAPDQSVSSEEGKTVDKDITAPSYDLNGSSDNNSSNQVEPNTTFPTDGEIFLTSERNNTDYRALAVEEDVIKTTSVLEDNNKSLFPILLSSSVGLLLGIIGSIVFMRVKTLKSIKG